MGTLLAEVAQLKAENQALKDESARLKGLPPRPPLRPSGRERATQPATGSGQSRTRGKRGRGAKRLRISHEQIVKAIAPAGSRFQGYEDVLVQDLHLSAQVIRYRR